MLIPCARMDFSGAFMRIMAFFACALLFIGCAREEPVSEPVNAAAEVRPPAPEPATIEPLPARYSGVLPCADCPGIRYDIDLRPRNVYFLRMTYLEATPERSYDDIGVWSIASDLRTLALRSARQPPMLFAIVGGTKLRRLNDEGQPIESELNYTLQRTPDHEALVPRVPLRGMYSMQEAQPVIQECTTGLELHLRGEEAKALAQQYEASHKGATRPLLLAVEGRVEVPASEQTRGRLEEISAAKFWPGEACGARGVTHDLEGTRWVLVRMGETPFVLEEGHTEPYIVLQSGTKQVAGHGGCNRLAGAYRIEGNVLEFGALTTTRMACPALESEHAFLNALEDVARWRLLDNQLELLDKNNVALLQLESRNL